MGILCWAAKNSLCGTLPRCTAGVAEPVLCSSRCLFLTSLEAVPPQSMGRLAPPTLLGWDHHPLAPHPQPIF
jgi:hypothetical protein